MKNLPLMHHGSVTALVKLAALVMLATTLSVVSARASDPIGIYALIDKVVFEPNEASPERVQIWGAFALAEGRGYEYGSPSRGYLYFKLNPDKKDVCLKEWADLKSVAGTKQVVGFATRYEPKGKVRADSEKPANPDAYPTGFGLNKARDTNYAPVKSLLTLKRPEKG